MTPTVSDIVIGIDLGGTHLRVGAFRDRVLIGSAAIKSTLDVDEAPTADTLAGIVAALIEDLVGDVPIRGIGVVASGPVDRDRRVINNPFTLPHWSGRDWPQALERQLRTPVTLENDAMGALIGEVEFGAGRGANVVAMVTLGTGIGVAVWSASTGPVRGARGHHPEGGHIPVATGGPPCYCRVDGCWEALASGNALGALWTSADGTVDWRGYGEAVTKGLVSIARSAGPDLIVIGGGVADQYDRFVAPIERWFGQSDRMGVPGGTRVVRAGLDESGLYGAAAIAAQG